MLSSINEFLMNTLQTCAKWNRYCSLANREIRDDITMQSGVIKLSHKETNLSAQDISE